MTPCSHALVVRFWILQSRSEGLNLRIRVGQNPKSLVLPEGVESPIG
jgi:hypothetical protein